MGWDSGIAGQFPAGRRRCREVLDGVNRQSVRAIFPRIIDHIRDRVARNITRVSAIRVTVRAGRTSDGARRAVRVTVRAGRTSDGARRPFE
jgi:hypothetical protein